MKSVRTKLQISACAIATAITGAARAQGQQATSSPAAPSNSAAASPDNTVQDIIVTAQRRSESLQKAALTIEVLKSQALAQGGISAPAQLTSVLPTVQIATAGPATAVYVRGVGGFAANSLTSPAVPYYFDGVYVARTQSVVSELYDVNRLELVKGPQGTLYGRNASGGAINILTNQPVLGRFEGHADLELGNYGNQSGEFAINVPIGDKAAIRASGTVVDKQGYTSIGLGDDVHQAGRLKALWRPDDSFSFQLNGSYGHIGGLGGAYVALNREIPGWYPWLDASDPRSQAFVRATATVPVPGFVQPTSRDESRQDLNFYNISAQLEWRLSPTTTLTIIPAYRHASMKYAILLGFLYDNGYGIGTIPPRPETSAATSVEARLSGNTSFLKWVGGLYFYNEDQSQELQINNGYLSDNGWLLNPSTRSYAAFGQATLSLTKRIRLIGGLRYTSDRRGLDGQFYLVSPIAFQGQPPAAATACAFPAPTQPQCQIDAFTGRRTYHNVSWKGGFEADVLRDSLLYATASRGFKAGGFSQQSALGMPGQAQPFKPEVLTSYEAGLKSRFLDGRLQVNVSGYYWDYKDHQEPVIAFSNVPGVVNQIYLNAGASQIYGGNLDVVTRPWTGATLSGSVEYAHSRYKSFSYTTPTFAYDPRSYGCPVSAQNPALTTLDCSGYEVSRTPKWSGQVGLDQSEPFGTGTIVGSAQLTFASPRWIGTDFIPSERVHAYGKLDVSLTYQGQNDRWSIGAFVRNVTNASIYTEASKNPFSSLVYANIQPPRTYGGRLSYRF